MANAVATTADEGKDGVEANVRTHVRACSSSPRYFPSERVCIPCCKKQRDDRYYLLHPTSPRQMGMGRCTPYYHAQ